MIVFGDVAVVVSAAKASAKWWTEKLGFELRDDEGHWITVAAPGSETLLHLCQNGTHEEGNTGIGFSTDDVAAREREWSAKGVRFPQPAKDRGWGLTAVFADPDGNEFHLFEDKDLAKPKPKPRRKAAAKRPAKKARKASKAKKAVPRRRR
jgi:catechol 2,3-dioxygenase-like lactoylglutathione lyase family enzyme